MSHSASNRTQQSRGKRALGLFVAVWLNLALAPCAMAMEVDSGHPGDHGCPHCPPAEMQGHHDMHAGMSAEMPCADGLADCELDDDFSHDARGGQAKLKDAQYDLPEIAVPSNFGSADAAPVQQRAPPEFSVDRLPAGPPIHLLNCVFLD